MTQTGIYVIIFVVAYLLGFGAGVYDTRKKQ
jgi:hypothetical protein